MESKSEQLKKNLKDKEVSGYSPAVLQHQGIRVLADGDADSMGDLTSQQITAFSILRAYNDMVPIPRTIEFINNHISLSRARDRKGRLEYAGCYKSYPGYVVAGNGGSLPGITESNGKPWYSKIIGGRKHEAEQ